MKKIIPLVGILTALIFVEFLLSKFAPQATLKSQQELAPACFAPSNLLPYELKKSTRCPLRQKEFTTTASLNSLGYRGQEFSYQKDPNVFRILVVGDSFTFGHGVNDDQTYSYQLNQRLKDQGNFEVINAGYMAAFSPDSYYLYLKEKGLKLQPNLVLLGFFIWNDISDLKETVWLSADEQGLPTRILSQFRTVDSEGRLTQTTAKHRYQYPLLRNSQIFQLLYAHKTSALEKVFQLFDQSPNLNPERQMQTVYTNCIFDSRCFEKSYLTEWEKVQKVLLTTNEMLKKQNIPLLVVLIPARQQVIQNEKNFPLNDEQKAGINKKISEFLSNSEINFLDLQLPFQELDCQDCYFAEDAHWTAKGHQFAAKQLAKYLLEHPDLIKQN